MLEHAEWRALGTNAHLLVLDGDLAAARAVVERVLDDVDRTYSRFRSDSELMRLQAARGAGTGEPAPRGRRSTTAIEAARDTDGAVDPTVGRAMRIVGYDDDFAALAGAAPAALHCRARRRSRAGGRSALDARTRTVRDAGRGRARPRFDRQGACIRPRRRGRRAAAPGAASW